MKTLKSLCVSMMILGLLASVSPALAADEQSIEIIDKTNWQKAEGLVPEVILEEVKQGRFILPVGEISYDPLEFYPGYAKESFTANVGKYELDEDNVIVDAKTGKMVKLIVGFPFPKVDPDDPKAAIKIMYNKQYVTYIIGCKKFTLKFAWIGRSGFEREIEGLFRDLYLTGFPGAKEYKNPRDAEQYSLVSVRKPYDLAGTSNLMWRYLDARADVTFVYIPAIRRVRRATPANRSDGFLGSDFAIDDVLAYSGKIPAFEWKVLGQKEALVPVQAVDPLRVIVTKKGEWQVSKDVVHQQYGYQEEGWDGASWCPLNVIHVKRPVWVIRGKSKDPYYNYGVQYIWVDAETWGPYYKLVHDRSDEFWKFMSVTTSGFQSADKEVRFLAWSDHLIVDTRREHATWIKTLSPDTELVFNAVVELNDFTLAGFQKYCK